MTEIQELLDYAFTMPTAIFSVLLSLVLVYWLVSLLGLFNLEMLDAAEGLAEGAAEGLAEGAAEGLAEAGESGGFFRTMGFGDVPRSITWSLVIFFGWLFSLLATIYLPRYTDIATRGLMVVTVAVAALSLGLAVLATAVAIQPLRKVILAGYGTQRSDFVGRICTIKTLRVDDEFGQAEIDDGSSIIQVRNPQQQYHFENGAQALIYEYDAAREVFYVMPAEREV